MLSAQRSVLAADLRRFADVYILEDGQPEHVMPVIVATGLEDNERTLHRTALVAVR
jgi:hypothetical protein